MIHRWLASHWLLLGGSGLIAVGAIWCKREVIAVAVEGQEPFTHIRGAGARLLGAAAVIAGVLMILAHVLNNS